MKKSVDAESELIRHDYKRALYRALLSELPPEDIIEFFGLTPLVLDGEIVGPRRLFDLLWSQKAKITCCFDCSTDNRLERFLISKRRSVATVLKKILWLNNNSTHIPGKILLTWFYPKLESVFNSVDTRDTVFAMITTFTENWLPHHIHRRIKRWEDGEWTRSILLFHSVPMTPWLGEFDFELTGGPQILNAPVMFSLPPFESFALISDFRQAESVVWAEGDKPIREGASWLIRGEEYGRLRSFFDFCREREIDVSKFDLEDRMVVVCTRDYFCPIRDRLAMRAGVAYGAPTCLHAVAHRRLRDAGKAGLGRFIEDMVREEEMKDSELEAKHQALISLLSREPCFEYHASDESLNLNGRYFTKGVPAQILKHLFESHLRESKCEFEYRDLKRIFEITHGRKNANFEVRFYRLVEKLKEECPAIRIEKTGRGRFSLHVDGGLQYREIAASVHAAEGAHAPAR